MTEAQQHRRNARLIRKHIAATGGVLGVGTAELWLAIAVSTERLAAALELPGRGAV